MNETELLIERLSAQGARRRLPMRRVWALAAGAAAVVAALVFFGTLGPRPDIAEAAGTLRFLFKFVVTLALFATALPVLGALARPETRPSAVLPMLLVAPGLLLVAVGIELMSLPADMIGERWLGSNAVLCLTFIPLIGAGPLAAFIIALRHGAPARPGLAGAVAGIVAGGLAASLYAAHCTDDSPLFVATWYTLAIGILALAGAVAGRAFARW